MVRRRTYGFSWRRAIGISQAQARLSRTIGIPVSRSGRRQKFGRTLAPVMGVVALVSLFTKTASNQQATPLDRAPTPVPPPSLGATIFGAIFGAPWVAAIIGALMQSWWAFWLSWLFLVLLMAWSYASRRAPQPSVIKSGEPEAMPIPDRPNKTFEAWTSGDLNRMLAVLEESKTASPVDRHYLLLGIVESAYRQRHHVPEMKQLCLRIGQEHIAEFPSLAGPLRASLGGDLPRVPTFQYLATVYDEAGEPEKAIEICKAALAAGLHDGTVTGFEGRIRRIQKKHKLPDRSPTS